jgi:hypothetical protein
MVTTSPSASGVSSAASARTWSLLTKTLMCCRGSPRSSHSRTCTCGCCRASSARSPRTSRAARQRSALRDRAEPSHNERSADGIMTRISGTEASIDFSFCELQAGPTNISPDRSKINVLDRAIPCEDRRLNRAVGVAARARKPRKCLLGCLKRLERISLRPARRFAHPATRYDVTAARRKRPAIFAPIRPAGLCSVLLRHNALEQNDIRNEVLFHTLHRPTITFRAHSRRNSAHSARIRLILGFRALTSRRDDPGFRSHPKKNASRQKNRRTLQHDTRRLAGPSINARTRPAQTCAERRRHTEGLLRICT